MNIYDYLSDAIEAVLTWDVPEESFGQVVMSHACLMAGLDPDEIIALYSD